MRNLQYAILPTTANLNSVNSSKCDANQLVSASFHVIFSGSDAAGTLTIQASNDPTGEGNTAANFTPTNWVDIPSASCTPTVAGSFLITIAQLTYRWVRVVWTRTSGTGTVTVNMNALGI